MGKKTILVVFFSAVLGVSDAFSPQQTNLIRHASPHLLLPNGITSLKLGSGGNPTRIAIPGSGHSPLFAFQRSKNLQRATETSHKKVKLVLSSARNALVAVAKLRICSVTIKRWRQLASSFALALLVIFSTINTPLNAQLHAAHASTSTATATTTATTRHVKANKLTYEDKLVQKYIEKHMFDDDAYDPFESTYKEYIQHQRSGVKPSETLEVFDADELTGDGKNEAKAVSTKVKGTRGISKNVKKKKATMWEMFISLNGLFTDFLRKTFKMSSKRATETSILAILLGGMGVLLVGVQFAFTQFKAILFKREGDRYGGRDYTAYEKDPDELDENGDGDNDDDDDEDDDEE